MNALDAGPVTPPTEALDLVNLVWGPSGLTTRRGFAEWCTGMTNPVRSLHSFSGPTYEKLFAATSTAIYDCSSSSSSPTADYTFPATDANSGFAIGTTMVTSAGHFYALCDETNGYLLYTESTDSWAAGSLTGATAGNMAFVMSWKNRLWFVEKNTAKAWYLAVGAISGTAASINFGNRFQKGGTLVGLWSVSLDWGTGQDDLLVAVSSAGDVLVYQGTDPASADSFQNVGTLFVGAVPKGRRICTDHGGDLLILTQLGIIPLSRLRTGTLNPDTYTTRKIQPLFASYMADRSGYDGWALCLSPKDGALLVNMPLQGPTYEQFAMSLSTGGWSRFEDVPALSMVVWKGDLYFGSTGGKVYKVGGYIDDVKIDGAATWDEIDWSGLTSFQAMGSLNRKQIQQITMRMWTQGSTPAYTVEARYDFDDSEIATSPGEPDTTGVAVWDSMVWDSFVWAGEDRVVANKRGATGSGVYAALAFWGRSREAVTIHGWDVTWTQGGLT